MKKLFFAILLMIPGLMVFGQTYSVTVSGTVEDIDTGDPIEGQMVFVNTDSISGEFFYYNMVFTDDNGYFEDSFDVPAGVSGDLFVSTMGCQGNMLVEEEQFPENNNNFTFTFQTCSDTAGGGDGCEAMFYYYPGDSTLFTLQFIDISTGDPNAWAWDFGDGLYSTEQNPLHTFESEGEYMVSLTISNDSTDCSSTYDIPVMVGDSIWFPDSCVAIFYAYPDSADFMTMNFMDMSIGYNGNPPDNWAWDFGDGKTSEDQNPVHTYIEEGVYEVCLTISTDDGDCENTYCGFIDVTDWNNGCQAQFEYYPAADSFPSGENVAMQFVDVSWGDPSSWTWDFGDGETSSEQNPIHVFEKAGVYQVCLSIANPADSCESTYCELVYVENDSTSDCEAWFEYETNDLTVDFEGFLMNSQSGEYSWSFGDGTEGNGQTISHTYASDGIYMVSMSVIDSVNQCYADYVDFVSVGDSITFGLSGYVYLEDSLYADAGSVSLMTFDTIGENLVSVAETQITGNGYYEFNEVALEQCIYFVQAELSENSAYYGDYLPTYHVSALNWMSAMPVFPFFNDDQADVYMIPSESYASGNGIISGTVTSEDGRSVMDDVEILLLDENNKPLTYDKTNPEGQFDFSRLPYGTYIVYTEIVGVETIPVSITLSADNPSQDINIVVRNGEALLGIHGSQSAFVEKVGSVYPNPAGDHVSFRISMKQQSKIIISITNSYGQQLLRKEKQIGTGVQQVRLNIGKLPKGIYFMGIQADDDVVHVQKLIKLK